MKLTEYVSLLGTIGASLVAAIGALITIYFSTRASKQAQQDVERHVREMEAERIRRLTQKHVNEKTQDEAIDTTRSSPDD
ncbi:hypothetical protein ACQEWB_26325 [Streptomyces sp. CA-249302]|uniref:hypothetical protein n=1 Tax=Streptomyces sp. CA-249302 TaxID=3240058 RepID=UPI003D89BBFF